MISRRHPALVALTLLIASCNSADGLGGGGSKQSDKSDDEITSDDPEDATVTEPQMISGAFLCGAASDYEAADGESAYGCAIHKKGSSDKIPGTVTDPSVTLTTMDGSSIDPDIEPAPEASPWHVHFGVPTALIADIVKVEAAMKIAGRSYDNSSPSLEGEWQIVIATDGSADSDDGGYQNIDMSGDKADSPTAPSLDLFDHVLFVTNERFPAIASTSGDDSAANADEICVEIAGKSTQLQGRTWRALISGEHEAQSLGISGTVGNTKAESLADAGEIWKPLKHKIYDERSNPVDGRAWTGTKKDGSKTSNTCNDWTRSETGSKKATTGDPNSPGNWLQDSDEQCQSSSYERHLYCISVSQ